ncbi:GNAT family N-acetyltransferase [Citricoccus muralis]|uniref:N-acetyltransferase n=1 Tax=Citricoccus muralis TaxID=169134 RepID=A0ABY8H5L1_9MICC|nr:N-acetyltransferase [Citricoccus muralis]WFP16417.1 N-acetyltransferase [Citricoccus muralis]
MPRWSTRAERPGTVQDQEAVRAINVAAFPTSTEAELVDALRTDPGTWIEGLSMLSLVDDGTPVGHALLTRCMVGGQPALALAPCAVDPAYQRQGAGAAAIRAVLDAARDRGENLVVVLGHPDYYPRFDFTRASRLGVTAPFEVPDEAFMALAMHPTQPTPRGEIRYPEAFGV